MTTIFLALLTLLAIAASAAAIRRLVRRQPEPPSPPPEGAPPEGPASSHWPHALVDIAAAGCAAVFFYLVIQSGWRPLVAHVDGLVLIAALLALTLAFLQRRPRLEGLAAFGLPVLAFVLLWAFCSSWWTYKDFAIRSVWMRLHLVCVFVGMLSSAVAAAAGAMYLFVERRLHAKRDLASVGRFASLEKLETIIVRQATAGFALLSLGLVTGLVIFAEANERPEPGWWYSPKIVLAAVAWLIYALLMNLRNASAFRGARAAWLSIVGLVLLLATYGVVSALPDQLLPHTSAAAHREAP